MDSRIWIMVFTVVCLGSVAFGHKNRKKRDEEDNFAEGLDESGDSNGYPFSPSDTLYDYEVPDIPKANSYCQWMEVLGLNDESCSPTTAIPLQNETKVTVQETTGGVSTKAINTAIESITTTLVEPTDSSTLANAISPSRVHPDFKISSTKPSTITMTTRKSRESPTLTDLDLCKIYQVFDVDNDICEKQEKEFPTIPTRKFSQEEISVSSKISNEQNATEAIKLTTSRATKTENSGSDIPPILSTTLMSIPTSRSERPVQDSTEIPSISTPGKIDVPTPTQFMAEKISKTTETPLKSSSTTMKSTVHKFVGSTELVRMTSSTTTTSPISITQSISSGSARTRSSTTPSATARTRTSTTQSSRAGTRTSSTPGTTATKQIAGVVSSTQSNTGKTMKVTETPLARPSTTMNDSGASKSTVSKGIKKSTPSTTTTIRTLITQKAGSPAQSNTDKTSKVADTPLMSSTAPKKETKAMKSTTTEKSPNEKLLTISDTHDVKSSPSTTTPIWKNTLPQRPKPSTSSKKLKPITTIKKNDIENKSQKVPKSRSTSKNIDMSKTTTKPEKSMKNEDPKNRKVTTESLPVQKTKDYKSRSATLKPKQTMTAGKNNRGDDKDKEIVKTTPPKTGPTEDKNVAAARASSPTLILIICILSVLVIIGVIVMIMILINGRVRRRGKYEITSDVDSTEAGIIGSSSAKILTVQYNDTKA